jgi:hypothetical protein
MFRTAPAAEASAPDVVAHETVDFGPLSHLELDLPVLRI